MDEEGPSGSEQAEAQKSVSRPSPRRDDRCESPPRRICPGPFDNRSRLWLPEPIFFSFLQLPILFIGIAILMTGSVVVCPIGSSKNCTLATFGTHMWLKSSNDEGVENFMMAHVMSAIVFSLGFLVHLHFSFSTYHRCWKVSPPDMGLHGVYLLLVLICFCLEGYFASTAHVEKLQEAGVIPNGFEWKMDVSSTLTMMCSLISAILTGLAMAATSSCSRIQPQLLPGRPTFAVATEPV